MVAVVIGAPGQAPTGDEQIELADRALSALAFEDHLAVLVAAGSSCRRLRILR